MKMFVEEQLIGIVDVMHIKPHMYISVHPSITTEVERVLETIVGMKY